MKRYIAPVVFAALGITAVVYFVSIRESALIHRSAAGTYRMEIPRKCLLPSKQTQTIPSAAGEIEVTMRTRMVLGNTAVGFALGHFALPRQVLANRLPDDNLAAMMNGVAGDVKGQASAPNRISFEGWPGLECTFDGKHGNTPIFGRIRVYQIDKDVIVLMAMGDEPTYKDDPNVIRYLDTFTFAAGSTEPVRKSAAPAAPSTAAAPRPSQASVSPAPAPAPVRKPPPAVDPATLRGKTLAEIKRMLGKPNAEVKMGGTTIWDYDGLQITSSDGVHATAVSLQ